MSEGAVNAGGGRVWRVSASRAVALDRARVIAILNVTPDSFSDGGRFARSEDVADAARRALADGADMLDVGGESTRPGAARIGAPEQIRRVVPAIRAIRAAGVGAAISVDTTLAAVAAEALDAGADAINDVSACREDPAMLPLVGARRAGLILMHRLTPPPDDAYSDRYALPPDYSASGGVVEAVRAFLAERMGAARRAGVAPESLAIDPGLGFGKTVEQNFELIRATPVFAALGCPVVGGASRKSFIGRVTGADRPADRVEGSIAASVAQRLGGAALFRVHDVGPQARALRAADAVVAALGAGPLHGSGAARCRHRACYHPSHDPARAGRRSTPTEVRMAGKDTLEFTDANFDTEVLNADKPVLVDFWAEWCMPCRMLGPTIDEVASTYAGKAKVGKVDTDSNRNVSVKYGIAAIPTVLLFHKGKIVKKFVGLTNKKDIEAALNAAAAG